MNIIFMGTPDFAVPALQQLISSPEHHILSVYSQPPRPAHRGQKLRLSPVHQLASDHNIPVYHPINFKNADDVKIFVEQEADIAVVAAYGLLLPKPILNGTRLGCINIHSSLLPRWRGAAPIHRAIVEGDNETGVTIMQMDTGLDTGAILSSKKIPLDHNITASILHDKLAEIGAELVLETLDDIAHDATTPIKQNDDEATYAKKLSKDEGKIDWNNNALTIDRIIKGLNPWPGTYFTYHDETIKLIEASTTQKAHNYQNGEVIDNQLTIACNDGIITPKKIQRSGKKPMTIDAFLRGYPIPKGTILN